ncbi:MAG TPA: hypothetical protein VF064_13370 [Pyrinomonadaceae bacterium]
MGISAPHSGQNFGFASGWWPHAVQAGGGAGTGSPHSGQNFACLVFAPHAWHTDVSLGWFD